MDPGGHREATGTPGAGAEETRPVDAARYGARVPGALAAVEATEMKCMAAKVERIRAGVSSRASEATGWRSAASRRLPNVPPFAFHTLSVGACG